MARITLKRSKQSGFTLVELLIVVAIIGVLSTIGIPTFRRMVQKSKKSEAKVNLGGLYTAEQAFYAEYGGYGNNLPKIGFQTDGTNLMYDTGFYDSGCKGVATAQPMAGQAIGANINTVFPGYYSSFTAGSGAYNLPNNPSNTSASSTGNTQLRTCPSYTTFTTLGYAPQGSPAGTPGIDVYDQVSGGGDAAHFFAASAGVIAPGVDKVNPAVATEDLWYIDETRTISNIQDGVK